MDLVDEQDVAGFQVGQQCRQVARLGDHGTGSGTKADTQLARDDLGQGRLAQTRRAVKQDMVQRLTTVTGGPDKDAEIVAEVGLADELLQAARAQGRLDAVLPGHLGCDDPRVAER